MDYSQITPEMAQAELARRQNTNVQPDYFGITPQMAQAELARRSQMNVPQETPAPQQSGIDKFNNFLQENVINPTEAMRHGALNFLSNVGAAVYKPADFLYGTNFVKDIREGQKARQQEFEKRFPDDMGAKALAFAGEELPTLATGLGVANKALKGAKLLGKPLQKALAENAIIGATAGGIQAPDEEKLKGILTGAVLGVGAGGAARGLDKFAVQPLSAAYARSAIPGVLNKAKDLAKERFIPNMVQNTANWNLAREGALTLDRELAANNIPFNAAPYNKYIDDFISKVESFTPAKKAAYKDALEFAKQSREFSPSNFEDVMEVNQNLNGFMKNFFKAKGLNKEDHYSKEFINGLKQTLSNDVLNANASRINPELFQQFRSAWSKANASHPKSLKSKYLRDIFEHGSTSKKIETLYGRLPNQQRQSLFAGTPEEAYLEAANNAMLAVGRPSSSHGLRALGHHIIGLGIPGALGFYGAEEAGLPFRESLGVGLGTALGAKGATKLIGKTASPKLLEKAARIAKEGRRNPGYLTNILLQNSPLSSLGASQ